MSAVLQQIATDQALLAISGAFALAAKREEGQYAPQETLRVAEMLAALPDVRADKTSSMYTTMIDEKSGAHLFRLQTPQKGPNPDKDILWALLARKSAKGESGESLPGLSDRYELAALGFRSSDLEGFVRTQMGMPAQHLPSPNKTGLMLRALQSPFFQPIDWHRT